MPTYEIVYETGNHSLAEYASDEEALTALNEHHDRAKNGVSATPESQERTDLKAGEVPGTTMWPAERIAKVYKFEQHPANFGIGGQVNAETLENVINSMKDDDGLINAEQAAQAVRATTSPLVNPETSHDSMYAMPHEELDWDNS